MKFTVAHGINSPRIRRANVQSSVKSYQTDTLVRKNFLNVYDPTYGQMLCLAVALDIFSCCFVSLCSHFGRCLLYFVNFIGEGRGLDLYDIQCRRQKYPCDKNSSHYNVPVTNTAMSAWQLFRLFVYFQIKANLQYTSLAIVFFFIKRYNIHRCCPESYYGVIIYFSSFTFTTMFLKEM